MKDSQGNLIRINDIVTFTVDARPRRLIGKTARVLSYGPQRLRTKTFGTGYIQSEIIRIEPAMVLVGEHTIYDPMYNDPAFIQATGDAVEGLINIRLQKAVAYQVISDEQRLAILDLRD